MTVRLVQKAALGMALLAGISTAGFAQNGPPSNYPTPTKSYGSGTSIGLAAGGAAVVALGFYFWHRHRANANTEATLVGCTQMENGFLWLLDDDTKTTYALSSLDRSVRPGERLIVSGKVGRSRSGQNLFRVRKLVRDDGPCAIHSEDSTAKADP